MKKIFYCALLFNAFFLLSKPAIAFQFGKMPESIQEMVNSSDLIVTGKIDKVLSKGTFYGYQENASSLAELDKLKLMPVPLGIPYVDYGIKIDRVFMTHKNSIQEGNYIAYRVFQSHTQAVMDETLKSAKNSTFFLSKAPKDEVYGIKTPMHHLHLNSNEQISYNAGNEEFTLYTKNDGYNLSYNQLIEKVKEAVSKIAKGGKR